MVRGLPPQGALDRGALTLENVIVYPAVLLFLALVLHFGIQFHNDNVAHTAATIAVNTARVVDGSEGAAAATARDYLDGTPLGETSVTVSRGPDTTTATVSGVSTSFVSFIENRISATVTAPTERWVD